MEEAKVENADDQGNGKGNRQETKLGDLDLVKEEGVRIQCVNSSEFVIGKQTSFNGPVTIINVSGEDRRGPGPGSPVPLENLERIVIRDRVLSKPATMIMQEMAKDSSKGNEFLPSKKNFWKKYVGARPKFNFFAISLAFILSSIVGAAVALAVIYNKPPTDTNNNSETLFNVSVDGQRFLYSKKDWGGEPPTSSVELQLPVPYVVISHSVSRQCFDLFTCSRVLYSMQSYHFSLKMADIAYNFLVDSRGNIYEGRGWTKRSALERLFCNNSIDINFIGDYSRDVEPTHEQLEGVQWLIKYGVENKKISETYRIISANATFTTLSPGKQVYKIIKNWPHFTPITLSTKSERK